MSRSRMMTCLVAAVFVWVSHIPAIAADDAPQDLCGGRYNSDGVYEYYDHLGCERLRSLANRYAAYERKYQQWQLEGRDMSEIIPPEGYIATYSDGEFSIEVVVAYLAKDDFDEAASASTPIIQVLVNGKPVTFDVPPTLANGRTLVPLRAIFEAMEASVTWDDATQSVTGTRGDTTVVLTIGSTVAKVNGQEVTLDVPAVLRSGRTFVPARFVAEALGAKVDWDQVTNTVIITDTQVSAAGCPEGMVKASGLFGPNGQGGCINAPKGNDGGVVTNIIESEGRVIDSDNQ